MINFSIFLFSFRLNKLLILFQLLLNLNFVHAERLRTGLLFIHDQVDNIARTSSLQFEDQFNVHSGSGAMTSLIMLPKKSREHRAKEYILHFSCEQVQELKKYVKNK